MAILDSGERRHFDTGAQRDMAEGKGRCDLLPLEVIAHLLTVHRADGPQDMIINAINEYVRRGTLNALYAAIEMFIEKIGMDKSTAILEVSRQYEDGAKKYSDRNWEKGIPVHCYIDSGVRHYLKHLRGDTDEPHYRAFIWNMLGAIWTHINKPELIDLPFAVEEIPFSCTPEEIEGDHIVNWKDGVID